MIPRTTTKSIEGEQRDVPIDVEKLLAEQLAQASPDLLRGLLSVFIQALMSAEADTVCGAGYGVRSAECSNSRNGYRPPGFRYSGRHHRAGDSQAAHRQLFPGLAVRAAQARRAGVERHGV